MKQHVQNKNLQLLRHWLSVVLVFFLTMSVHLTAQQLAFPTAEGFGAYAQGGRGGDVYIVASTEDYDPDSDDPNNYVGTLRHGLETQNGPRTIVFEVSGIIALKDELVTKEDYLTIAGQTAPGDGICLKNYRLAIKKDHIIVRHIRSRLGIDKNQASDAISIIKGKNIIVDHCSVSWSVDEGLSTSTGVQEAMDDVTVQWCIIAEGLDDAGVHPKPGHSYGALIRGCYGAKYSYLHNLFANNRSRNPRPGNYDYNSVDVDPDGLLFDFRNNVMYNWGGDRPGYDGDEDSRCRFNYVNNYGKPGPESDPTGYAYRVGSKHFQAYFSGNHFYGNVPSNQWDLVDFDGWSSSEKSAWKQSSPFPTGPGIIQSAEDAYSDVLAHVGAAPRDEVDERIIGHVIDGNVGAIIDKPSDVGGYPDYNSSNAPNDGDNDGMPDSWEDARGLDKDDANDRNDDDDSDGYTNLEEYLNELAGDEGSSSNDGVLYKRGSGSKNQTVDVGTAIEDFYFEWENAPTVTVSGVPNGINVVIDNTAQTASFSGAPSEAGVFEYTVTTSDGADSKNGTFTANGSQSGITLQAEDAELANSAEIENEHAGFMGSGYVNFPSDDGLVRFKDVDGGSGGAVVLQVRYANGANDRTGRLKINGVNQDFTMEATGGWDQWVIKQVTVVLSAGATNTIIFRATGNDFGNLDQITVDAGSSSNFSVNINFQTVGFNTPTDYLADEGDAYGDRGNGFNYGWVGGSNGAQRDRGTPADDRYATLNHMQKQSDETWEIEVPNGTYDLFLVCGDGSNTDQTNDIDVEGQIFNDPDGEDNFDEFTITGVTVSDGKLTIKPAAGADNAKICFVDIDGASTSARFSTVLATEDRLNFELKSYPNPLKDQTTIHFRLPESGKARMLLYGLDGRIVRRIVDAQFTKGEHKFLLKRGSLHSGVYLLRIDLPQQSKVLKVVVE